MSEVVYHAPVKALGVFVIKENTNTPLGSVLPIGIPVHRLPWETNECLTAALDKWACAEVTAKAIAVCDVGLAVNFGGQWVHVDSSDLYGV
jgi:hypothetical protein